MCYTNFLANTEMLSDNLVYSIFNPVRLKIERLNKNDPKLA